jgi:hypothetical protein
MKSEISDDLASSIAYARFEVLLPGTALYEYTGLSTSYPEAFIFSLISRAFLLTLSIIIAAYLLS